MQNICAQDWNIQNKRRKDSSFHSICQREDVYHPCQSGTNTPQPPWKSIVTLYTARPQDDSNPDLARIFPERFPLLQLSAVP